MRGLSLVAASGGHSSSRCVGLSLSRALLLRSTGSRRAGSIVVAHGPSCSAACGVFPDQGSNPCPLHCQADSQPLRHQGSPSPATFKILSLPLVFVSFNVMCLGGEVFCLFLNHILSVWSFLRLCCDVFHQCGETLSHYFFKYYLCPISSLPYSRILIICRLDLSPWSRSLFRFSVFPIPFFPLCIRLDTFH